MKKAILFLTALIFIPATFFGQTKTYHGAWFDINYPSNFIPRPSMKSATSATGYESVFFTSPDGLVEFYIFSPQWNGNPTDIVLRSNEKATSTTSQTNGSVTVKWWTITSKDGSYTRTYQENRNSVTNTNWVIGIKYRNQLAYNQYKKQYLAFKASLVQFGD